MKAISGQRLAAILRRKDWEHVRIAASHHIYRSPDGLTQISIPVHGNKDLKPGTQGSLMKQAGITDADL